MKFSSISKSTYRRAKGPWPDRGPKSHHIYAYIPIHTHTITQACACVREGERVYKPRGVCKGVRVSVYVKVSVYLCVCVCQREKKRIVCV